MSFSFAIETAAAPGAVGLLRVTAGDDLFGLVGMAPVAVGRSAVRTVCGVDQALVARPTEDTLLIMPHGGDAIMRGVADALAAAGGRREPPGTTGAWPEASDLIETGMLSALASAASPLAIDLLLDQPRRWRLARSHNGPGRPELADASVLGRLLVPPVVVAVGEANIGKSSLLNALAGAPVALAFDRAGTTRDTVGALVDLGGLVVRWVDTPGVVRGRVPHAVRVEVERAAVVLRCADAVSDGPVPAGEGAARTLVVATRGDLGAPGFFADATVSARTGAGVVELAARVRETLTPASALAHPGPWKFWEDAGA